MMDPPLALDDLTTWPEPVHGVLRLRRSNLKACRLEILKEIDELLRDSELIGYHCTRLTEEEISRVEIEGLSPLSESLLHSRVRQLVEAKQFSSELAHRLLPETPAANRIDQIHLFLSREIGDYCWPFFRYWGGEALYARFKCDPDAADDLLKLSLPGQPCIVEARVPSTALPHETAAGEILYQYGRSHGVSLPPEGPTWVNVPLKALTVIRYGSDEFERRMQGIDWHHGGIK